MKMYGILRYSQKEKEKMNVCAPPGDKREKNGNHNTG